jgi:hypothetical protein
MVFLASFCFGLVFIGAILINNQYVDDRVNNGFFQMNLRSLLSLPANCDGRIAR